MAKPPPERPWTVNHPRALTKRREHLWTVDDDVPGLPGAGRRMTIVRRADGTLLFVNAIPLPEATLAEVRALGTPAVLLVPNVFHSLDAGAFVKKLGVVAYAPAVAVDVLASRVTCRPIAELPLEEGFRVFTVEGFRTKEVVVLTGDTLVVADLVTNVPNGLSPVSLLMRVVGFTGPAPKLPKPVRKRVEVDTAAVKALLHTLSDLPGLTRLIPTHGDVLEAGVPEALRGAAAQLA